jgi:competence CoiA-like predicted nuclease
MKITISEFYDIYTISLMANNYYDKSELLIYILPIAEKYIEITKSACKKEMKHLFDSYDGFEHSDCERESNYKFNTKLINKIQKDYNIKLLKFKELRDLFYDGKWSLGYGGEAWGDIVDECIKLKKAVEKNNLTDILLYLDRLNQLEHNNALYLSDFTTFVLKDHLDNKFDCSIEDLLKYNSNEIKKLYKKYLKGI